MTSLTFKTFLLLYVLCVSLFAHEYLLDEEQKEWIRKHNEVSYAGDPNWLPFEAFDAKGNYIGIVADHLQRIEEKTALKFKPLPVKSWTESLQAAQEKKVSVVSGDIADTVLKQGFRPIEPYIIDPIVILMDSHANYVDDLNTLRDKKIAIVKSYGYTADLYRHYPQIRFIEVDNIQEGLHGVSNGLYDAMLASNTLANYSIEKMRLDNVKTVGKTTVVMEVTLFVDKDEPILYTIINQAVKSISAQERKAINFKWVHSGKYDQTTTALQWAIILLSSIMVAILIFTVHTRNRSKKHLALMKRLESAQELGHMGSWEWNMLTGELNWSDEVYRIFGEVPQSFPATYERFKSYIPEEFHQGLEAAIEKSMQTKEPYEYNHLIRTKDGTVRTVREAGYIRFDNNGKPLSMLGTVLDINSIVQARSMLRQNEELNELLEKFDMNVIASNTDLNGHITYASKAFCKISGYSADELMGRSHKIIRHPDTPKETFRILWDTIKSGRTWKGEIQNRRKDGTSYWVESTISPIYNSADEMIGYSSIRRDITHEKEVEELHQKLKKKSDLLQEFNEELEERIAQAVASSKQKDHMLAQQNKLASMGEMIGNIAHQWRQPLNALSLLLQKQAILYERGLLTAEKVRESIEKGTMLINQMSTTIDDFRDFFKPDKQKVAFDIKNAVDDTIGLINAELYNKNINLIMNIEDGHTVFGYKNEFSQVILNLISNAKDILVENRIEEPVIRIDAVAKDDTLQLYISDNGGGIPEAILEHVFEPYFTTKEEGQGTGIGLYMSKMIIEENMHGKITAANDKDGAVFTISLDLHDSSDQEEKAAS